MPPARPTQTAPPFSPNPFTWRGFANVRMGDYLLGEDTVELVELGFCGETVAITCPACNEALGHIPVELLGDEFRDITTTHVMPALDWHNDKHHRRNEL